jgi:hypothetical protein
MFRFPLTVAELYQLSDWAWRNLTELEAILDELSTRGLVTRSGAHYLIGDPDQVEVRRAREDHATRIMPRAIGRARLIASFPWVRSVSISGTLSKGVFEPGDDVDYFVITSPGRLWMCRLALMGFKKSVLLNSRRLFCVNYLVSSDHLVVPDHNLFTAMEIAWLRPVVDDGLYEAFVAANRWIGDLLPNWSPRATAELVPGESRPAAVIEKCLAGTLGARGDDFAHRLFSWRNRRRYRELKPSRYDQAMRATKHASKHHPRDFQSRVLERHASLLREFEERFGMPLGEAGAA